jgi:hypothetical protein
MFVDIVRTVSWCRVVVVVIQVYAGFWVLQNVSFVAIFRMVKAKTVSFIDPTKHIANGTARHQAKNKGSSRPCEQQHSEQHAYICTGQVRMKVLEPIVHDSDHDALAS